MSEQQIEEKLESPEKEEKNNNAGSWRDFFRFAIIAAFILLPIRFFVAEPYLVRGSSMEPTFQHNSYLIVDHITSRFKEPQRGDVVIFKSPVQKERQLIKRLVGLPNETVIIKGGEVTIKNKIYPDGFTFNEPYLKYQSNDEIELKLGEEEYFVMGDNRTASFDSRRWGALPKKLIVGQPIIRLFPLREIGLWPGAVKI